MPEIKEIQFILSDGSTIAFKEPLNVSLSATLTDKFQFVESQHKKTALNNPTQEVDIHFETLTSDIKHIVPDLEKEWAKHILKNN